MKKLLSLLIVVLMAVSAAPYGVFVSADSDVQAVNEIAASAETTYLIESASVITAEMLANGQDPDFITENLVLPANDSITWTTSDASVISTDGTVVRPELEDAMVTLTATDTSGSGSATFTVKASTISGVAINESFNAPFYNSELSGTVHQQFTSGSTNPTVVYADNGTDYYLDYSSTVSYAASQSTFSQATGTAFPVGSTGKYIFEFDACFDNKAHQLFVFTGNGSDAIRFNNSGGKIYISNINNVWYGDATVYANVQAGVWYPIKMVIDLAQAPSYTLSIDNTQIASGELISGSAFDSAIGMYLQSRADNTDMRGVKIDNFKLYTQSTPDEAIKAMSNGDKARYFAKLVTENTITSEQSYNIENNLSLGAPFAAYNLADLGVSVSWTSSDTSVISNDGTVTRQTNNRYVVMTANITAGSGDDAVEVLKSLPFTVAAAESSIFAACSYNFEADTVGNGHEKWTNNSYVKNADETLSYTSTSVVGEHSARDGKVMRADFTGSGYARSNSIYSSTHENNYFVSADVCFEPDATSTKTYFELFGATTVARVGFNFQNGAVILSGDNTEREYMVPGIEVKIGEWYHIDIDFNAAKKNFMAYINGHPICAEPLDIPDSIWAGVYYVRCVGLYFYGAGTGYIDNVIIRQSNYSAPVYDENSDYTVRRISLTNQDGKTITNATAATTKVVANVKLIENRMPQDGDSRILFARYNTNGKLEEVVSQKIETTNKGLSAKIEMPLNDDCTGHSFKIFVFDTDSLKPMSDNYSSIAPKFDRARLFAKATNVEDALELGYDAESEYEGIDAIIYDGDTYLGRKARHFAYIGLPEGASAENPVPAVVCVHGGGGTAFDTWVKKWNDAGYAAIAMNLNGRIPQDSVSNGNNQLRHAWAGATQDNYGIVSPDDATWMYSAVTAVIAAHNVLREMPEVDNSKIGITGVSWGGVVTSTAIGVDDRFAFAIPSYGCGYLYGSETYMANAMTEDKKLWDPSNFIGNADLPILWMNGDRDGNFSLTSTTKSALLAGNNSYVSIIPGFAHDHSATWDRAEGYAFADSIVRGGAEFIRGSASISNSTALVKTNKPAVSATMYYTTSDTLSYEGTTPQFSFEFISNRASNTDTFTFEIPPEANKFFIVFRDEKDNNTSTVLYDVNT